LRVVGRQCPRQRPPRLCGRSSPYCYCFVWLLEVLDEGWFADDDDGWLLEAELADWFVELELAGWFAELELADWLAELELAGWFAEAEVEAEDGAELSPAMSALAAFAWSIAACVRGPMMPSIGPGSNPLSFNACCSCLTDSSPCAPELALMPEALAPLVELAEGLELLEAPLVPRALEPLVLPDAMLPELAEGWFAEAEVEGWLVEAAGWFAEAEVEGWFAEADFSLSVPAAIAVLAAIKAATRASFLNMVDFLSFRAVVN
jgi:hypothetical protein